MLSKRSTLLLKGGNKRYFLDFFKPKLQTGIDAKYNYKVDDSGFKFCNKVLSFTFIYSKMALELIFRIQSLKKSIFQTFQNLKCCTKPAMEVCLFFCLWVTAYSHSKLVEPQNSWIFTLNNDEDNYITVPYDDEMKVYFIIIFLFL